MPQLTEDDLYRTSTQYRLWSFTPESLISLRSITNATAAEGVRAAIDNLWSQRTDEAGNSVDGHTKVEVDCLTVEEEQRLVGYYCLKAMQIADFLKLATNVKVLSRPPLCHASALNADFPHVCKATAVQYLKRFYLSNSPMTYHPKEVMPTALFLSTKTENSYMELAKFASALQKPPEDVIAPEFLLIQGLRFTFEVRHPYRGLEGGYMEMLAMANGRGDPGPGNTFTPAQLRDELKSVRTGSKANGSLEDVVQRLEKSKAKAMEILKTSAILTDAYLLYTPSQVWLSALYLVDEPLSQFYINAKLPSPSPIQAKLLNTIYSCASLLRSSPSTNPGEKEMNELKKIDKKLYKCRNPEKIDLVGINKAQKREGAEDGLDEKVIKKRKLEREKSEKEAEDVFGPSLQARQQ